MTRNLIRNISLGLIAASILCLTAVGIFNYTKYYEVRKIRDEQQLELARARAEIVEIENTIELFRKEREEFETYLFSEQDIPGLLDGISQFAQETNVNIMDMKTKKFKAVKSPSQQGKNISSRRAKDKKKKEEEIDVEEMLTIASMPIKIAVEGTYQSFVKFLNQLEDFKQLLTVSNVNIVSGRDYPLLKCNFTLKIYSFKTLAELERK